MFYVPPLQVTVHSANVPDPANILGFQGATDPFATVSIGPVSEQTQEDRNTNHPRWEEDLTFTCVDKSLPIAVVLTDKGSLDSTDELLSVTWDDWISSLEAPPAANTADDKLFKKEGSDYWVLLSLAAFSLSDPAVSAANASTTGVVQSPSFSYSYSFAAQHDDGLSTEEKNDSPGTSEGPSPTPATTYEPGNLPFPILDLTSTPTLSINGNTNTSSSNSTDDATGSFATEPASANSVFRQALLSTLMIVLGLLLLAVSFYTAAEYFETRQKKHSDKTRALEIELAGCRTDAGRPDDEGSGVTNPLASTFPFNDPESTVSV